MEVSPVCYPIEYIVQKHQPDEHWTVNMGEVEEVNMTKHGIEVDFVAYRDQSGDVERKVGDQAVLELQDSEGRIIFETLLEFEGDIEEGTLCLYEG